MCNLSGNYQVDLEYAGFSFLLKATNGTYIQRKTIKRNDKYIDDQYKQK